METFFNEYYHLGENKKNMDILDKKVDFPKNLSLVERGEKINKLNNFQFKDDGNFFAWQQMAKPSIEGESQNFDNFSVAEGGDLLISVETFI